MSLAQYFQERIPNLANINEPLRLLLKNFKTYKRREKQEEAFEPIKISILLNFLGHFDASRKIEVWVDAGPNDSAVYIVQSEADGANCTLIPKKLYDLQILYIFSWQRTYILDTNIISRTMKNNYRK